MCDGPTELAPSYLELAARLAAAERERDEARERAAGLSRELLDAMQARDSYRASADLRVGMRREFEALLGCGDTTGEEAFAAGLARLRALVAAESRAERLEEALREIVRWDSPDEPLSHAEFPARSCPSCIARRALDAPVWDREAAPSQAALDEEDER